jgi:hypothetical protein
MARRSPTCSGRLPDASCRLILSRPAASLGLPSCKTRSPRRGAPTTPWLLVHAEASYREFSQAIGRQDAGPPPSRVARRVSSIATPGGRPRSTRSADVPSAHLRAGGTTTLWGMSWVTPIRSSSGEASHGTHEPSQAAGPISDTRSARQTSSSWTRSEWGTLYQVATPTPRTGVLPCTDYWSSPVPWQAKPSFDESALGP